LDRPANGLMALAPDTRDTSSASSNVGLLLGVPGLWSITPLIACWSLCALAGVRTSRQRGDTTSTPTGTRELVAAA
jgi:hypothetical protein